MKDQHRLDANDDAPDTLAPEWLDDAKEELVREVANGIVAAMCFIAVVGLLAGYLAGKFGWAS